MLFLQLCVKSELEEQRSHKVVTVMSIEFDPLLLQLVCSDFKQKQETFSSKQPGNRNKGKGNGAQLAWESHSHCFADKFGITHAHSFGTDTQHDHSQGNFFRVLISK